MEGTKCYLLQNIDNPDALIISLDSEEITVGRKTFDRIGCVPQISRKHASFQVSDRGQWFVKDLNSTNGVYINEVRIGPGLHALTNGDIIGFGAPAEFDFTFCSDNSTINNVVSTSSSDSSSENSSLSYKRKYADIINSEFPKVILKKCVIPVAENRQRKSRQPDKRDGAVPQNWHVKRQKIIRLSSSSDSDSESALNKCERSSSGAGILVKQNISPRLTTALTSKSNKHNADLLFHDVSHEKKSSDFFSSTGPTVPTIESVFFNPGEQSLNGDWDSNNHLTKLAKVECPNEIIQNDHEKGFVTSKLSHKNISKFSNLPVQQNVSVGREITNMTCNGAFNPKNLDVKEDMASSYCPLLPEIKLKREMPSPPHDNNSSSKGSEVLQYNNVEVKVELHSDDVNKNYPEDFSYSQEDEVIVISDDDDYFYVPSSQPEVLADLKTEPPEDEIEEFNQDFEENEGIETFDDRILDLVNHATEEIQESENINNIEQFLSKTNSRLAVKESKENEKFFPELSQNFFNSSSESSDEDSSSTKRNHISEFGQTSHAASSKVRNEKFSHKEDSSAYENKRKQKISKTMLTDPKPMEHRPRYQRGREEWFEDRYGVEQQYTGSKKQIAEAEKPTKSKAASSKGKEKASVIKAPTVKVKKKDDLRKKIKEQMGHRFGVSNTRSAVPMSDKQAPSGSKVSDSSNMRANKTVQAIPKRTSRENIRAHDVAKVRYQRNATVKKRPEGFGSRMNFLIDSDKKCDSTTAKKPVQKNSKNDFKIPKLKGSALDETSVDNASKVTSKNKLQKNEETPENTANKKLLDPQQKSSHRNCSNSRRSSSEYSNAKKYHQELSTQPKNRETEASTIDPVIKSVNQPLPENFTRPLPVAKVFPNLHSVQKQDLVLPPKKPNCIRDPRLRRRTEQENRKTSAQIPAAERSSTFHNSVRHSSTNIASSLPILSNLSVQIDDDVLVSEIIGWNPAWLGQYVDNSKPPPLIRQGAIPLPLFFATFDEYARCFYSLIRLELWESIFLYWKEHKDKNTILLMVSKSEQVGEHMTLECESFISSSVSHEPKPGSLMVIELRVHKRKEVIKVFGYVTGCKTVPKPHANTLHEAWNRQPEILFENFKFITFTLKTKKKPIPLDFNMLMKASLLNYVANRVRVVNIFKFMMTSPITSCILQPYEEAYSLSPTCLVSKCPLIGNYNELQKKAIVCICNEIKLSYMEPKVILLQGPPGTGKTHTIVGLVEALHTKEHKVKILITAPSNAAVDEIGRRLIDLRRRNSGNRNSSLSDLRIVRVGSQSIHSDVLPYSLEEQAKRNSRIDNIKAEESLKRDYYHVTASIEELQLEIKQMKMNNAPHNDIMAKLNELTIKSRRQQHVKKEMHECHNKLSKHVSEYNRKIILEKADVILTTLSSCGISILSSVFGPKSNTHFTFCIVDEATQCTEPEILQPLVFGLTKFVLVGDHQQLPATVQSKLASDLNFERSLFERVHLYFQKSCKKSPIFMLDTQYRMHSEICKFPSSHFYSHKLVTAPDVDSRYSHFPFKPFTILDIVYSQESNSHSSKANVLEAEAIMEICKELVEKIPRNYTVGIITPYQAQKHIYTKALSCYPSAVNAIEVNTVDSFQGRQKDVIILSCVRAKSCTGSIGFLACSKRLNVAITRAKQCLIICGHMKSLKQYPLWTSLITYAEKRKCYISVIDTQDISFVLNEMRK